MGKHSKQSNTREFFTYAERQRAAKEHGTQSRRLGAESQRAYDSCNLCLSRLIDPVATPKGLLYCRQCIYANLLAQNAALEEERKAYEAHMRARAAEREDVAARAVAERVEVFRRMEGRVTAAAAAAAPGQSPTAAAGGAAPTPQSVIAAAGKASRPEMDERDRSEKRAEVQKTSFWIPDATPSAAVADVKAPDPCARDPVSGEFLRVKQLITVNFTRIHGPEPDADEAAAESAAGGTSASAEPSTADDADTATTTARFMCPACMKPLQFQKTYLFRPCGHVTCDKCTAQFVVKDKACFVCSTPLKKEDVIPLQQGGSSFAGHSGTQTIAKKYTPTLIS